jgi:hypothetical protein
MFHLDGVSGDCTVPIPLFTLAMLDPLLNVHTPPCRTTLNGGPLVGVSQLTAACISSPTA